MFHGVLPSIHNLLSSAKIIVLIWGNAHTEKLRGSRDLQRRLWVRYVLHAETVARTFNWELVFCLLAKSDAEWTSVVPVKETV